MNSLYHDIRYALRQLRKSPGFALTAVLTLAFGISATTAIFSIVEGVLLRPLPFADPDTLVTMGDQLESAGADALPAPGVTAPEIIAYGRDAKGFSGLGGYTQASYELSGIGEPAQISATRMAAGVFPVLGVAPLMGRYFTAQEDTGSQPLAVVSYQMWRSRLHGDAHVLGQKILLDRKPYEIIGVMPRTFEFPLVPGQLNRSELWTPISLTPGELTGNASSWNYSLVGRLKAGVTPAQAQSDAVRVAQEIMHGFPPAMAGVRIHPVVNRLDEDTVAAARPLVRTLFLAVTVVLFIACANLAGLLLVRVIRRRREIAVRMALGARNLAILRQMLVETLALSVGGGLLGLGLASIALRVGIRSLPETLPRISAIGLDWRVVSFALLLAVATGLVCGLLPAFAAARTEINDGLKEGGRTGTAGGGHARLRSALVIAEIAVALVLLVASGLLLRSFEKLRAVSLGVRADHALTASYSLPKREYPTQTAVDSFNATLLPKLQQIPGVQMAGITTVLPASGQSNSNSFIAEGYVAPKGVGMSLSWTSQVMGGYLSAMGIPIVRGRDFTEADRAGSPFVVIVNHTLAQRYWPGQDPIGKRLHWGLKETPLPWMTVVGEIGDVKQTGADEAIQDQIYQPAGQFVLSLGNFAPDGMLNGSYGSIVLRGALPPERMVNALYAAVRSIDPRLPLTQVESMERVVEEGQAPRRFNTAIISAFAAAAVLLALLGIYSVIAFSAALRMQEMAIRLALGAQRSSVMQLILASGAKLGLAGCGIGAVVAFFATRLLRSFLFQVDPLDPAVLAVAAVSIFTLALAASVIPARRAALVEPVEALRSE
jgi:putative ABC transport system permease protein